LCCGCGVLGDLRLSQNLLGNLFHESSLLSELPTECH